MVRDKFQICSQLRSLLLDRRCIMVHLYRWPICRQRNGLCHGQHTVSQHCDLESFSSRQVVCLDPWATTGIRHKLMEVGAFPLAEIRRKEVHFPLWSLNWRTSTAATRVWAQRVSGRRAGTSSSTNCEGGGWELRGWSHVQGSRGVTKRGWAKHWERTQRGWHDGALPGAGWFRPEEQGNCPCLVLSYSGEWVVFAKQYTFSGNTWLLLPFQENQLGHTTWINNRS